MTRNEAVQIFGSVQELYRFLGLCGPHAVYNWKPHQRIPAKHEVAILDWQRAKKKSA